MRKPYRTKQVVGGVVMDERDIASDASHTKKKRKPGTIEVVEMPDPNVLPGRNGHHGEP